MGGTADRKRITVTSLTRKEQTMNTNLLPNGTPVLVDSVSSLSKVNGKKGVIVGVALSQFSVTYIVQFEELIQGYTCWVVPETMLRVLETTGVKKARKKRVKKGEGK